MFFILAVSLLIIHNVNSSNLSINKCDKTKYVCLKAMLDDMLVTKNFADLDAVIDLLKKSKGELALKENLLGVAYILKKNEDSNVIAKQYLKAALEKGVLAAATNLAELYYIEKDYSRSLYFLDIAKQEGFSYPDPKYLKWATLYAQNVIFSPDSNETQKNIAVEMMLEILDKDEFGYIRYILGISSLQNGDLENALRYFKFSAEKNLMQSFIMLGILYYEGNGVERDVETAIEYFEFASVQGSGQAAFNLATISFEAGKHEEAKKYLVLSAKRGYKKAIELYDELVQQ